MEKAGHSGRSGGEGQVSPSAGGDGPGRSPRADSRLLVSVGAPHGFEAGGGAPGGAIRARQVHGAHVVDAAAGPPGEADALVSAVPGSAVAVVTADCVPLLLATRDGDVVAAVHAGWRGLAAGVVERAVTAVRETTARGPAGSAPGPLVAALGPSASGCCYEVGDDVVARLGLAPGAPGVTLGVRGRPMLDLRTVARARLVNAGLDPRRIERVGPCTICSARWPSWRREADAAGRATAWIAPAER